MELQDWLECGICKNARTHFIIICAHGHSFCMSCARKLTSVCPICRSDLIRDAVEDYSRRCIISQMYDKLFEDLKNNIGCDVDAMDCDFCWYEARIVSWNGNRFLVHFYGWDKKWDEWVPCDPKRIAPHHTYTTNWISHIRVGQLIEFKLLKSNNRPVWYKSTILYTDPQHRFIYVDYAYKECSIKIKWDKDWISPVGVHTRPISDKKSIPIK